MFMVFSQIFEYKTMFMAMTTYVDVSCEWVLFKVHVL